MEIKFDKIVIKNFKNLRNVEIHPEKFNVIVGPNGSGKTNFIEFFKLLRKIYFEKNPYPFLDWGGYSNVVWNHENGNPIEYEFSFVVNSSALELKKPLDLYFFARKHKYVSEKGLANIKMHILLSFSSKIHATEMDKKKILETTMSMSIKNIDFSLSIRVEGDNIYISLDKSKFFNLNNKIKNLKSIDIGIFKANIINMCLMNSEYRIFYRFGFDLLSENLIISKKEIAKIKGRIKKWLKIEYGFLDTKASSYANYIFKTIIPSYFKLFSNIFNRLHKTIFLFPINIKELKYCPRIFPKEETIKERGENTLDILAQIQFQKSVMPDTISYFVENFFGGKVYFKGAGEGRLNMYYNNGFVEISKENLPDGLFKSLVILTSIEQKPYILLVDEIENSLHPELIEYLINALRKEVEGYVFLSTHSPIVLNLVDPENIWIFKPKEDGIYIKNATEYKNKEELLKELEELGISLGEKVLYGFM